MGITHPSIRIRSATIASGLATLLLSGCITGTSLTDIPARIDYTCANNRVLQVARTPDQRTASVLVAGQVITLFRADSAAQEKYSDGRYTLYLEGERAMLEEQNRVIFGPCVSPVPLPTYIR